MRNTRDLMRDWCAATGYSLSDLIGRGRVVREAGLLTQGGHGINAPAATLRDGAVLLLSIVAARLWKDVAKGVEKYGKLPLYSATGYDVITRTDFDPDPAQFPLGTSLFGTLATALEHCGSQRAERLLALKVERSETSPEAILAFGLYEITPAGETHTKTFFLTFARPPGQHEVYEESGRLNDIALNTMADLLAPNVAATNRARMQAKHETGPSALTDEPIPFDDLTQAATPETNPSDNLPRATTPTATDTHPEANDKEKESQVGFESCGRSSGGSSLPPTESCDDRDDRPDPPAPCVAKAPGSDRGRPDRPFLPRPMA
jgi:hypothetical protein